MSVVDPQRQWPVLAGDERVVRAAGSRNGLVVPISATGTSQLAVTSRRNGTASVMRIFWMAEPPGASSEEKPCVLVTGIVQSDQAPVRRVVAGAVASSAAHASGRAISTR